MTEKAPTYEESLSEALKWVKIVSLTPQENMKIHEELGKGMGEFCREQRNAQAESLMEIKTIVIF